MFGNLKKIDVTKTTYLTIFIMFLSEGILKLQKKCTEYDIFLNIMKLN